MPGGVSVLLPLHFDAFYTNDFMSSSHEMTTATNGIDVISSILDRRKLRVGEIK